MRMVMAAAVVMASGAGAQGVEERTRASPEVAPSAQALANEVASLREEVATLKAELRRMAREQALTEKTLLERIADLESRMLFLR